MSNNHMRGSVSFEDIFVEYIQDRDVYIVIPTDTIVQIDDIPSILADDTVAIDMMKIPQEWRDSIMWLRYIPLIYDGVSLIGDENHLYILREGPQ